jgi:hypothetical protein
MSILRFYMVVAIFGEAFALRPDNLTLFQLEIEELQDDAKISEEKYR